MSAKQVIDTKLLLDIGCNVVTTTAQFGEPLPSVLVPFIASDFLYSGAIKNYVDNNWGGNEGISDELSRDIIVKTALTGSIVWVSQLFTGEGVGLLQASLNALVSYSASNGVQDLLEIT